MTTVREFVTDSYQLISASNPTVPLHGSELSRGIRVLNRLLKAYASDGLLLTIAKTESVAIIADQQNVTVGPASYSPTPDIAVGRLANMDSAWILLDGVTYPLIEKSESEFNNSYKYDPLAGLPRFIIADYGTEITTLRLYPKPSQAYTFFVRGKFQLDVLTSNDNLDSLPGYYERFLWLALARDLSLMTGRTDAWTPKLETMYNQAYENMVANSEVNLDITAIEDGDLNGRWAIQAGV